MFKHKIKLVLILAVTAFAMLMITQGDPLLDQMDSTIITPQKVL